MAWLYLADLRERAGDAEGAAAARARAATAERDPRYYFERTWIHFAPEEARAFLERRIEERPDDGMAFYLLAFLDDRDGRSELARLRFRRSVELGYRP
jgi:hypothetical protein